MLILFRTCQVPLAVRQGRYDRLKTAFSPQGQAVWFT